MASKIVRPRVNKYSPEWVVHSTIGQLRFYFEETMLEGKFEPYLNGRMDEMARDRAITDKSIINAFIARNRTVTDELQIARDRMITSINMSLYYCFVANLAYAKGRIDKAWFYSTQASKWQGIASGSEHAFYVRRSVAQDIARSGGLGRRDRYEPLKQFSFEAVQKRKYPSRRNAALSIKPDVLKLAAELGIAMSEQQAEKTITGWLKDIPFASRKGRELVDMLR